MKKKKATKKEIRKALAEISIECFDDNPIMGFLLAMIYAELANKLFKEGV